MGRGDFSRPGIIHKFLYFKQLWPQFPEEISRYMCPPRLFFKDNDSNNSIENFRKIGEVFCQIKIKSGLFLVDLDFNAGILH